jgi:hypothetical protein
MAFNVMQGKKTEEKGEGTYIRLYGDLKVRFERCLAILNPENEKGGVKVVGQMVAEAGVEAAEAYCKTLADEAAKAAETASKQKK